MSRHGVIIYESSSAECIAIHDTDFRNALLAPSCTGVTFDVLPTLSRILSFGASPTRLYVYRFVAPHFYNRYIAVMVGELRQPSESKFPGLEGYPKDNLQSYLLWIAIGSVIAGLASVILRAISRRVNARPLWYDDWMIIWSGVSSRSLHVCYTEDEQLKTPSSTVQITHKILTYISSSYGAYQPSEFCLPCATMVLASIPMSFHPGICPSYSSS